MTPESFDIFRHILRMRAGLAIPFTRFDLLERRLLPVAQRLGFETLDALADALDREADLALETAVIDAAVTSETLFFRDRQPFDDVRAMLQQVWETRAESRCLRIWSAACSTGQEAYSLAMILDEQAREFAGWRIDLVATDLSNANLATAEAGYYNQFEVQRGLPIALLLRHFHQEGTRWRVADHLRRRVAFERFNLLDDPARLGQFDIIFCRNVLLYFDSSERAALLARIAGRIRPGGVLVLGSSETTVGLSDAWQPHPRFPSFLTPVVGHRRHLPALAG